MGLNRIITRGMGTSRGAAGRAGMVTSGFGGLVAAALEQARRVIRYGRSGAKRLAEELDEIIIHARLIRVNQEKPDANVQGSIKIAFSTASHYAVVLAERVSTRARKAWEDVKISVQRLKLAIFSSMDSNSLTETVSLDLEESNELSFKIKIEGSSPSPAKVRLVCESEDVSYMFNGYGTGEDGVVQFVLPQMSSKLAEGTYNARVEVLIENRYFAPVQFQIAFKKALKVMAESIQVKKKPSTQEFKVTATPIVVQKKEISAEKLTFEQRPAPRTPSVSEDVSSARANSASTLRERYASKTSPDALASIKRLAQRFSKLTPRIFFARSAAKLVFALRCTNDKVLAPRALFASRCFNSARN